MGYHRSLPPYDSRFGERFVRHLLRGERRPNLKVVPEQVPVQLRLAGVIASDVLVAVHA